MAYEQIILLGNDAKRIEQRLSEYSGEDVRRIKQRRLDPNTTISIYHYNNVLVKTLFNEYNEISIGDDIPNQARCNIGIEFLGESEEIKKAKKRIEEIVDIKLVPGRKTAKIVREGIR